jgi:hypothetical protein
MRTLSKAFILLTALVVLAAGLGAAEKQLPSSCKRCNMRCDAADRKFLVTVAEGMEASVFDDIGCALEWREGECAMRTSAFDGNARVHDFRTGEPVLIEQSFFVHAAGLTTPMGYDIAAFKNKEDGETLVRENGRGTVLTFNQLCSVKLKQETTK